MTTLQFFNNQVNQIGELEKKQELVGKHKEFLLKELKLKILEGKKQL